MAVKKRNAKRNRSKQLISNSVKIRCCFCDIKDNCKTRKSKEKSENMGFITYCTLTPNKTKSFIKKSKK